MISKDVMSRPKTIDTRDPGSEKAVVKRLIKKRKYHRKAKRRSNGDFFKADSQLPGCGESSLGLVIVADVARA